MMTHPLYMIMTHPPYVALTVLLYRAMTHPPYMAMTPTAHISMTHPPYMAMTHLAHIAMTHPPYMATKPSLPYTSLRLLCCINVMACLWGQRVLGQRVLFDCGGGGGCVYGTGHLLPSAGVEQILFKALFNNPSTYM